MRMTNAEKFREVFGLPSGIEPKYFCFMVECEKVKCVECPVNKNSNGFWDKEYNEPESEDIDGNNEIYN